MTAYEFKAQDFVIAEPTCSRTSPLLSAFGSFGAAFDCEKPKGHAGSHGRVIKWLDESGEVGRVDAEWNA